MLQILMPWGTSRWREVTRPIKHLFASGKTLGGNSPPSVQSSLLCQLSAELVDEVVEVLGNWSVVVLRVKG